MDELILNKCQAVQGQDDIYFVDGFPIPVCQYARASRNKTFKEVASFSYCASKKENYFGFKGHIIINFDGMISNQAFASAGIDECDVLHQKIQDEQLLGHHLVGGAVGIKGYIKPLKTTYDVFAGFPIDSPQGFGEEDVVSGFSLGWQY